MIKMFTRDARSATFGSVEERWNLAIAANNDGIFDWDLTSGEIIRSARCLEIFGYPDRAEAGPVEEWYDVIHAEDAERVFSMLRRYATREQSTFEVDYRILIPNGETRWILSRAQGRWDESDNLIRMVGSVGDVCF